MWIRIDDQILENPKVLRVGPKGFVLYVASLTFCGRSLTDGYIPRTKLHTLVPWMSPHEIGWFARRLVEVRLWVPARNGYRIHDYLMYNPSKDVVLRDRQNTARRVKEYRRRHGVTGDSNAVSNTVGNAVPVPIPIRDILNPPLPPHESGGREPRQTPTVEQTKAYLARLKEGGV